MDMIDMSELITTKSVEQLKEEMGPLKPSQILRMTKVPQYRGGFSDGRGSFCARGAVLNHFGWTGDSNYDISGYWKARDIEDGLIPDHSVLCKIAHWNDHDNLTFEQIADKLEEMGY